MIIPESSSCSSPIATWFPSNHAGSGHPHIICPMEKYIRTSKNPSEAISRRLSFGVSRSASASASAATRLCSAPFCEAPYPAASTAAITACGDAVPSTPMELVSRLTEQDVTPDTCDTAFSTRVLHAAQLIPVTVYCSMCLASFYFIIFCSVVRRSSITSSFPSRISCTTQVRI